MTSSLPSGDVQFDGGADVVDDAAGAVTGALVRTGHLRHRDVAVPSEWIAGLDDRIRLSVSAAEATGRRATAT